MGRVRVTGNWTTINNMRVIEVPLNALQHELNEQHSSMGMEEKNIIKLLVLLLLLVIDFWSLHFVISVCVFVNWIFFSSPFLLAMLSALMRRNFCEITYSLLHTILPKLFLFHAVTRNYFLRFIPCYNIPRHDKFTGKYRGSSEPIKFDKEFWAIQIGCFNLYVQFPG